MDQDNNNSGGAEPAEEQKTMSRTNNPFANYQPSQELDTKPKLPLDHSAETEKVAESPTEPSPVPAPPAPVSPPIETPSFEAPSPVTPVESTPPSPIYPSLEPVIAPPVVNPGSTALGGRDDNDPVPVVKVLSVRGVEYAMMSILLWFAAGSLIFTFVSLIYGGAGFDTLSFPISLLLVTVPGFGWLYLRLRAAELLNPRLRLEPSKRRFSQITQILAFLTIFSTLVSVVNTLVSLVGGAKADNVAKFLGASLVTLLIAGGILAYYWIDEHRAAGN